MIVQDCPRSVIILAGRAGVGKDSAAAMLRAGYGALCLSYAGRLKRALAAMSGVSIVAFHDPEEKRRPLPELHGHSPRSLMQWFGTDVVRKALGQDWWVERVAADILRRPDVRLWCVTDARFDNEIDLARHLPGYRCLSILITRDAASPAGGIPGHESEPGWWLQTDARVANDGSFGDLAAALETVLAHHWQIRPRPDPDATAPGLACPRDEDEPLDAERPGSVMHGILNR